MKKILVIGAHFDDPELGAGGSMAKWVSEGKEVYKLTLTDNVTNFTKKNIIVGSESSIKESAMACEILGVEELTDFIVSPCTELVYNKNQMQQIESFIIDNNIDTVVSHNIHDVQQDHVGASTISYVAGRYCDNILMYQSNKYIMPRDYYPRIYVDITNQIDLKQRALSCYSGAHNRYQSLFSITVQQNRVNGYQINMENNETYAEAFVPIKYVIR